MDQLSPHPNRIMVFDGVCLSTLDFTEIERIVLTFQPEVSLLRIGQSVGKSVAAAVVADSIATYRARLHVQFYQTFSFTLTGGENFDVNTINSGFVLSTDLIDEFRDFGNRVGREMDQAFRLMKCYFDFECMGARITRDTAGDSK